MQCSLQFENLSHLHGVEPRVGRDLELVILTHAVFLAPFSLKSVQVGVHHPDASVIIHSKHKARQVPLCHTHEKAFSNLQFNACLFSVHCVCLFHLFFCFFSAYVAVSFLSLFYPGYVHLVTTAGSLEYDLMCDNQSISQRVQ